MFRYIQKNSRCNPTNFYYLHRRLAPVLPCRGQTLLGPEPRGLATERVAQPSCCNRHSDVPLSIVDVKYFVLITLFCG
jgi:hypothetical protein